MLEKVNVKLFLGLKFNVNYKKDRYKLLDLYPKKIFSKSSLYKKNLSNRKMHAKIVSSVVRFIFLFIKKK